MDFKQIRIEQRKCGYWIAVDDTAAICLGPEEALGCIASGSIVMFAGTKEEERAFHSNLRGEFDNQRWAEFLAFLGLPFEPLEKTDEEISDGK